MFHFAAPEVNGFAVTTSTPGLIRSFQLLIFFGFPSRRPKTTSELVTIPLYDCLSQFALISPAATIWSTSRPVES